MEENELVIKNGTVIKVKFKDQLCFATAPGENAKPRTYIGPCSFRHTLTVQSALMQLPGEDAKCDNQSTH